MASKNILFIGGLCTVFGTFVGMLAPSPLRWGVKEAENEPASQMQLADARLQAVRDSFKLYSARHIETMQEINSINSLISKDMTQGVRQFVYDHKEAIKNNRKPITITVKEGNQPPVEVLKYKPATLITK